MATPTHIPALKIWPIAWQELKNIASKKSIKAPLNLSIDYLLGIKIIL